MVAFFLLFVTLLEAGIENELGINVEKTSIYNDGGMTLRDYGAGVRYQMNRYMVAPRFDLDYVNVADYDGVHALFRASVNGVYTFEQDPFVHPYLLAGLGYEYVSPEQKDAFDSHFFVQGGAGLSYRFKEGYSTHMEGRVLQILSGDNQNNEVIFGLGMSFPLGKTTQKVRKVLPPPPKKKIIIRRPVRVVRAAVKKEPKPTECSIKINRPDRDRDGVEDRFDQCPATPCDFSVDRYGCPIKTTLEIHFPTNSARIEPRSLARVDRFAHFLLKHKGSMVKIIGHTDSIGSEESNLRLSYRRADSVAKRLVALGVSPARISIKGMGERFPIASNKTAEGRAKNRRIEAILSYPDIQRP